MCDCDFTDTESCDCIEVFVDKDRRSISDHPGSAVGIGGLREVDEAVFVFDA